MIVRGDALITFSMSEEIHVEEHANFQFALNSTVVINMKYFHDTKNRFTQTRVKSSESYSRNTMYL